MKKNLILIAVLAFVFGSIFTYFYMVNRTNALKSKSTQNDTVIIYDTMSDYYNDWSFVIFKRGLDKRIRDEARVRDSLMADSLNKLKEKKVSELKESTLVNDDMLFSEAFMIARREVGKGGVFYWNGRFYNTFYDYEWVGMSHELKVKFSKKVNNFLKNKKYNTKKYVR